jgi:hypothetical protein
MEEVLPPATERGAGFERTQIPQFTIFMENRVGRLTSVLRLLEESVTVVGLSIREAADSALVRVICARPDAAKRVLTDAALPFSETYVLAVELTGRHAQPLTAICTAILAGEINIHYAYPLLVRPRGPAIAMYVDDPTLAAQLLIKKGFTLIGESDLLGN